MIPESRVTANVTVLANLEHLLQKARLAEFWTAAAGADAAPIVKRLPGFGDAVRSFASGVLSRTYRRISVAVLAESLGFDEAAAVAWARSTGWTVDGDTVELPSVPENTQRPVKKAGEDGLGLRYADVASVLGSMA